METAQNKVQADRYGIRIDGEYKVLLCSSLFYFRIPRSRWQERIDALLRSGYNAADVYFPWNFHEREEGKFDFSGERDVRAFLKMCAESGLYVIARFGPYICSEWTGGALPARVVHRSEKIRTSDPYFLAETMRWYGQILPRIAPFQYGKGGSVILAQLENELDFFDCDDVDGYISALRDKARECGITVPLFCCAGQGNAVTSGGLVKGVLPTYNYYPNFSDGGFDGNCVRYARTLGKRNLPLLVTETGRETALHKREFAGGAKLIGAYNQVAGSNFEYYQSVNNWGHVASAIVTEYDFASMVDVLGRYTGEVREARLFTRMLLALGERAAKAAVSGGEHPFRADFPHPVSVNALALEGGGELVCVANLGEREGEGVFEESGLRVRVRAKDCVLLPVGVPFGGGVIAAANCEIYSLSPLVLYGEGGHDVRLNIGGKEYRAEKSGVYGGVSVTILTKEEMAERDERETGGFSYSSDKSVLSHFPVRVGDAPGFPAYAASGKDCSFEANGIWQGAAEYRFRTRTKKVLFRDPADFMTVYDGGKFAGTTFERGKTRVLTFANEEVTVRSEKWGACNFDESRESSLRIKSTRGVRGFYDVLREEALPDWQLTFLCERAGGSLRCTENDFDPIVGLNGYNSTRMPFKAVCYRDVSAGEGDAVFFSLDGGSAECTLFVDGKYAGDVRGDRNMLEITSFLRAGKGRLQLLVRKRDWAEAVGDAKLFVCASLQAEMRAIGEKYMRGLRAENALPVPEEVRIPAGEVRAVEIDLTALAGKDCVCVLSGEDYKLTAVCGGKVVARMIAPGWQGVDQQGGSRERFLLPAAWRTEEKTVLFAESIGENTAIRFRFEY